MANQWRRVRQGGRRYGRGVRTSLPRISLFSAQPMTTSAVRRSHLWRTKSTSALTDLHRRNSPSRQKPGADSNQALCRSLVSRIPMTKTTQLCAKIWKNTSGMRAIWQRRTATLWGTGMKITEARRRVSNWQLLLHRKSLTIVEIARIEDAHCQALLPTAHVSLQRSSKPTEGLG